jgi:hypothetical protein
MRRHPFFQAAWYAINFLFAAATLLLVLAITWEYSTRKYLKGFADAIVPLSATPEQKVEAILAWMKHGPARRTTTGTESLARRDPQDTLNYQQLLKVCGTATNAFVNLASSSGLQARRLLLLGSDRQATHVVAEVRLDGRWAVVDPAYRTIFRDDQGQLLTRQQLSDSYIFLEATRKVEGYPPQSTFDRTAHVRMSRVPVIGRLLRRVLDRALPRWDEAVNWTLVLEARIICRDDPGFVARVLQPGDSLRLELVRGEPAEDQPRASPGAIDAGWCDAVQQSKLTECAASAA